MKYLASILICFFTLSISFAEDGGSEFKKPELVKAIGFKASLVNGKVVCTWKKYLRDDFKWY